MIKYGPNIVNTDLVCHLDAANPDSYKAHRFVNARIYSVYEGLRSANFELQYSDDNSVCIFFVNPQLSYLHISQKA